LAYTSRFTFTGDLIIPKNAERFFKEMKGGKNKNIDMASINFGVKESKFNSCFVECFGSVYDTIKIGSDEIPWANRFDEDVVAEAPRYRKYIVDLDGEEKEFLAQYDFVKYLAKVLPEYEGKVECSGRFTKTPYKGQYYDHYEVDTVRASTAVKNSLEVKMDLFYNKDKEGEYCYQTLGKWIILFSKYIETQDSEAFVVYSVIASEAFDGFFDSDNEETDDGQKEPPKDEPEDKDDGDKQQPEAAPTPVPDMKIHKL